MFCANCACELPAIAKFCVRCGSMIGRSTILLLTTAVPPPAGQSGLCLKCGGRNPTDYCFCTTCGAPLSPVGSPVFVPNTVTAFHTVVPAVQNETAAEALPVAQQATPELRGVGGWLLFFCIGLIFVAPLADVADIVKQPSNMFVVVFDLGLAAFAIYTGVAVWQVQGRALRAVKIYFVVVIILAVVTILLSIFVDTKGVGANSPSLSEDIIAAGRSLAYVTIWWSYFRSSERVRATFGSNL